MIKKRSGLLETQNQPLTKEHLTALEEKPKTKLQILLNYLICLLPVISCLLAIAEYKFIPNLGINGSTNTYTYFLGIQGAILLILFCLSLVNKKIFKRLRYKAPFYTLIYLLFLGYDYLTLKTGILMLPYFPWFDQILNAMLSDHVYLLKCVKNSMILLFTGYFIGVGTGLITGTICGYSKKVNYWISPFMKLLGAIPTTTWLPIVMVLAASLFNASVFIIALGVWFSVTIATMTGIQNIDSAYFDAARTLGATNKQLILKIAFPSAIPNIFQGLTQGMSSACTSLMIAEMLGVESGLGWYITWQKSWAEFAKMYAAIIIICIVFVTVNFILNKIKKKVLVWQEEAIS